MAAILSKQTLIDKSNSTIVAVTAVAAFVIVFCLVASKTLISQELYNGRVIDKKKAAVAQLKTNLSTSDQLVAAYKAFVTTPTNIIGGSPSGTGPQDGDSAQIVLDALPSTYDFPALTTSLEKIITSQNMTINSITGTDDEVAQQSTPASPNPQPIAMPFTITVEGTYTQLQALIGEFEHSIRPFQVQTMELTGNQDDITATINAQTFYQPEKSLGLTKEVVK